MGIAGLILSIFSKHYCTGCALNKIKFSVQQEFGKFNISDTHFCANTMMP